MPANGSHAQRRPALTGRQRRRRPDRQPGAALLRSTKAGPDGPATLAAGLRGPGEAQRSTKAGPDGPATPGGLGCNRNPSTLAQRRPALTGRQRWGKLPTPACGRFAQRRPALTGRQRSSARASTCLRYRAQRRPALTGRQRAAWRLEGRQAVILAQRRPALTGRQRTSAVARRRGPRPRSTKAGPDGPATRGAGGVAGADRRVDVRSTKAGPDGPATLPHGQLQCNAPHEHHSARGECS